jgi:hypothetical protein
MIDRRTMVLSGAAASVALPTVASGRSPVLVELFTSQGCSSCPPADAVLSSLARRSDIVALSFHVDYWDYIGWKDPFASPSFTRRQRDYAKAFGNRSVYTPQMVFNGRIELAAQTEAAASRALAQLPSPDGDSPRLHLERSGSAVAIDIQHANPGLDIWAAAFSSESRTPVRAGENTGRSLINTNIVRELRSLGRTTGAATMLTWPDPQPDRGYAVWLQEPALGSVLAATMLSPA